jgi:type I restriction enzyme M protein
MGGQESFQETGRMSNGNLNWIANFIWGIADDVLRDVYVRGKYRDVVLPMTVIWRLDAVLEPTKQAVLARLLQRPGTAASTGCRIRDLDTPLRGRPQSSQG